jgi:uncharacterized protein
MIRQVNIPRLSSVRASLDPVLLLGRLPVFFLLVFALSIPFWLIGGATDLQLISGLSVSALAAVCPMLAALLCVHQTQGSAGALALLKRCFDFKRVKAKRWYLPVLFLMPAVGVAVYGLMRWMDMPLPAPELHIGRALVMFIAFFVAALGEELGWSGYAINPMQARWGALRAALLLGVVGVVWHVIPLMLSDRSAAWIGWWCLYGLASRILIVWLYNNTGKSVFAAAVFHAMLNLSWMLFPVYGSHFDIRVGSVVMACTALVVVIVWGPKTMQRRAKT